MKTPALFLSALCAFAATAPALAQHARLDSIENRFQPSTKEALVGAVVGAAVGTGVGVLSGYSSGNTDRVVQGAGVGMAAGYAAGTVVHAVRGK